MTVQTLHSASWLIPVTSPALRNGGVLCSDGLITSIGPVTELAEAWPQARHVDHGRAVLVPALINAHIHLELSHILIPAQKPKVAGFTDWIEALLSLRESRGAVGSAATDAARKTLADQYRLGVIALGDIGNTDIGARLQVTFPGTILHFNEVLGRSQSTRKGVLERLNGSSASMMYTAHAPYSTHGELITLLKQRAREHGHPFPIHTAEPSSELELLCRGSGELYDFLKGRRFIDDTYQPPGGEGCQGSVHYLHSLGILDEQTICVHCIHVQSDEVRILADTGAKVCLCPGSNRYLHAGKAPVFIFLTHGLLPALGTDSAASNPELSLWREMRLLAEEHPAIDPAIIFRMATLGGAEALGLADAYGSLAPGRSTSFLAVPLPDTPADEAALYDRLINFDQYPTWVNEP